MSPPGRAGRPAHRPGGYRRGRDGEVSTLPAGRAPGTPARGTPARGTPARGTPAQGTPAGGPHGPWIAVANAPVSYGAFEVTVGHDPNVPAGLSVLDQVAAAGYAGIDLGPVGYLGEPARLGELLAERGLGLAGGYLELPYADHDALQAALADLDALLDAFAAVAPFLGGPAAPPPPRPTLADNGSAARRARPGRSRADPSQGLNAGQWRLFATGLAQAVARCRDRGYEPTFHP